MIMKHLNREWNEAVDTILFFTSVVDTKHARQTTTICESIHECLSCNLFFASSRALKSHNRVVHGNKCNARSYIGSDFKCPVCRTVFGSRLRAIAHLSDQRRTKCTDMLAPNMQIDCAVVEARESNSIEVECAPGAITVVRARPTLCMQGCRP